MFYWIALLRRALHGKKVIFFFPAPAPGAVTWTGSTTFMYNHTGHPARSLCSFSRAPSRERWICWAHTWWGEIQRCWKSELCFRGTERGWEPGTGWFSGLSWCCIILKKPCSRAGIRELPSAKTIQETYKFGENILTYRNQMFPLTLQACALFHLYLKVREMFLGTWIYMDP